MKPGNFLAVLAVGVAPFTASFTFAQFTPPVRVQAGETLVAILDADSPALEDGGRYGCYSVATTAKEEVLVTVESQAFDPIVEIARGALCHASSVQYENDNLSSATTTAQVAFKAAGGRYLIIVKSKSDDALGSYRLQVGEEAVIRAESQASSSEDQRRRHLMEMEIQQREAELAAAEAERAALEAQQAAMRAASLASLQPEESTEYSAPQPNLFMVFAETLVGELAEQQQMEYELQQGLDRAIRMGEAQYQRKIVAQERAEEQRNRAATLHRAAAEKARAAEQARLEAEIALRNQSRVLQEQRRAPASETMGRDKPISTASRSKASTDDDPHLCIGQPQQVRNPNCKDGTAFRITNACEVPVDLRVCIRTIKGQWDCGVLYGVQPGANAGWPSCFGTSDVFVSARNSDSDTPLSSPP